MVVHFYYGASEAWAATKKFFIVLRWRRASIFLLGLFVRRLSGLANAAFQTQARLNEAARAADATRVGGRAIPL